MSRLNVTDAAVVGTIVACPKCRSMVQVERPMERDGIGQQVAIGTADVDSQAITQDGIQPPDANALPVNAASGKRFLTPETGQRTVADSVVAPPPPSPNWHSEQTNRSRQIGLVVALAICSLVSALLIFGWFVRSWSETAATVDPTSAPLAGLPDETDNNIASETTVNPVDTVEPMTDDANIAHDSTERTKVADPANPSMVAADIDAPGSDASPTHANNIDSPLVPVDLIPQSPLITPMEPSGDQPTDPPADVAVENPTEGLRDLPPGLAEFTNLIDLANDGGIRKPTLEAPPSMDALQIEGPAEELLDPMMIAAPPSAINMKRGLSTPIAFAPTEVDGYPLADLTLLISQVIGVPIQLDWISFDLANRDVRQPVRTDKGMKDARIALDEIAKAAGAVVELGESIISMTPSDAVFGDSIKPILDLTDFGNEMSSAADVINGFLGADANGNDPVGVIAGPTRPDQQLAALAVDTVRRMRDIKTKIPDQRFLRWAQAAEQPSENWILLTGGKGGPQYDAPVTIAEVLRRVARNNDASCIVNWSDARRRRLSPEQLTMPLPGPDGGSELDRVLKTFDMQARKVDENHWWVGTAATYDRLPLVIWTQPLGQRREAFTQQIKTIMAGSDAGTFRMAFDPVSDRAILMLPRFVVRQLPAIQAKVATK